MVFEERKRSRFLGLPLSFTKYFLDEEKITIRSGFLNVVEDDAMMYKIQDMRLTRSICERLFGLGTIICYTGDTTHPELKLIRVRKSSKIKDFILDASEEARRKRRTFHSLDIDAMQLEDDPDSDNE